MLLALNIHQCSANISFNSMLFNTLNSSMVFRHTGHLMTQSMLLFRNTLNITLSFVLLKNLKAWLYNSSLNFPKPILLVLVHISRYLLHACQWSLGYKMYKHILKVLTHCSAVICMALDRYNKLAPCQKPPHPKLEYSDVISYSTLREFSLLKTSYPYVLMKPWA